MTQISPCTYCSRVPDPRQCDNKKCVPWQKWFLAKWEETRKQFSVPYRKAVPAEGGIPLGGHRYPHPHRVREYRENGPCPACKLPKELCTAPCPAQEAWLKGKEKVDELESRSH